MQFLVRAELPKMYCVFMISTISYKEKALSLSGISHHKGQPIRVLGCVLVAPFRTTSLRGPGKQKTDQARCSHSPCGSLSSRLLVSAWTSLGCWGHLRTQQMNGRYISIYLFLLVNHKMKNTSLPFYPSLSLSSK